MVYWENRIDSSFLLHHEIAIHFQIGLPYPIELVWTLDQQKIVSPIASRTHSLKILLPDQCRQFFSIRFVDIFFSHNIETDFQFGMQLPSTTHTFFSPFRRTIHTIEFRRLFSLLFVDAESILFFFSPFISLSLFHSLAMIRLFVWYHVLSCFRCLEFSFVALSLFCQTDEYNYYKYTCFVVVVVLSVVIRLFCLIVSDEPRCVQNSTSSKLFMSHGRLLESEQVFATKKRMNETHRSHSIQIQKQRITQKPNYRSNGERKNTLFRKTEPNETNIVSNSNTRRRRRRLHVSHFVDKWKIKTIWILNLCHEIWMSRSNPMDLMMVNAPHSLAWHCFEWSNFCYSSKVEIQTNIFDKLAYPIYNSF